MSASRLLKAAASGTFLLLCFAFLSAAPMHTAPPATVPASPTPASITPLLAPLTPLQPTPSALAVLSRALTSAEQTPISDPVLPALIPAAPKLPSDAEEFFFRATNRERASQGLPQLKWDGALAEAARKHAALMASHKDLSHQLPGEPALDRRITDAGIRFSHVGENVAIGVEAPEIHSGWMHSPGHRANILGTVYNSLGVGVVEEHDHIYAVEDFSTTVDALSMEQQEEKVATMLTSFGYRVDSDRNEAREICSGNLAAHDALRGVHTAMRVLQYEAPDLNNFSADMGAQLRASEYHHAQVGACKPKEADNPRFHVTILLF
jgi:uncharacterized protein YkwD